MPDHGVTGLGTSQGHPLLSKAHFTWLTADTTLAGAWQAVVGEADAVVNLAGRTIFKRWSPAYKVQIVDSRIQTTRNIVEAMQGEGKTLISTSAVGYYGNRDDEVLTEQSTPGPDFLARLSVNWEQAALDAARQGVRVAIMRFGVVLGSGGGALAQMLPAFRMFAGGPLGSGRQWFSWIHLSDLLAAVQFLLNNATARGAYNFCAPGVVRQKDFARALGAALRRPAVVPAPFPDSPAVDGRDGRFAPGQSAGLPRPAARRRFCLPVSGCGQCADESGEPIMTQTDANGYRLSPVYQLPPPWLDTPYHGLGASTAAHQKISATGPGATGSQCELPAIDYVDLVNRHRTTDHSRSKTLDIQELSRVFRLTHDITARSMQTDPPFYYRSVASAGALYLSNFTWPSTTSMNRSGRVPPSPLRWLPDHAARARCLRSRRWIMVFRPPFISPASSFAVHGNTAAALTAMCCWMPAIC